MITNEVEKIAVIEVFIVSGALVLIILLLMIGVVTTNAIQKGVVRPKLRKQKVEPQLAGPMPGVCQCGDALCYTLALASANSTTVHVACTSQVILTQGPLRQWGKP